MFLYAETHYCLKYLRPRYFKKESEIIFDLPTRVLANKTRFKLPIFLIVKDSDRYPTQITNIKINVFLEQKRRIVEVSREIAVTAKFEHFEFALDIDKAWLNKYITLNIEFKINGKRYINDNYYGSTPHNFRVFISDKERLFPESWHIGDVHYHSCYTSDQVEFGAPISMTKKIAYAMGLDWFFVTDHSYDLDDSEDDYTINDPALPKWEKMKAECQSLSDEEININYGEEISIGNLKQENVHLLMINNPDFIEGKGDSAEEWFSNSPDEVLSEESVVWSEKSLLHNNKITPPSTLHPPHLKIAAHPFEPVPLAQRLTLNRGKWSRRDFEVAGIKYLQIINGEAFTENLGLIEKYFRLLLTGRKYFILAGNDAHGNFQFMKQIEIPFIKLMCRKQQLFGDYFTAFKFDKNDPIVGIQNDHIIISNGPFLDFSISKCPVASSQCPEVYHIGQTLTAFPNDNLSINYQYEIERQHGKINKLQLIIGNIENGDIRREILDKSVFGVRCSVFGNPNATQPADFSNNANSIVHPRTLIAENAFYCILLTTDKGYLALTNPIWVEVRPQTSEGRPQTSEGRPQTSEGRPQTSEDRPQKSTTRKPKKGR